MHISLALLLLPLLPLSTELPESPPPPPLPPDVLQDELHHPPHWDQGAVEEKEQALTDLATGHLVLDLAGALVRHLEPRCLPHCTSPLESSLHLPVHSALEPRPLAHPIAVWWSPPASLYPMPVDDFLDAANSPAGAHPETFLVPPPAVVGAARPEIVTHHGTELPVEILCHLQCSLCYLHHGVGYSTHPCFLSYDHVYYLEDSQANEDAKHPEHDENLGAMVEEELSYSYQDTEKAIKPVGQYSGESRVRSLWSLWTDGLVVATL